MTSLLQIGAGNIGRACVGRLFSKSGSKIVFSDVNTGLLDALLEKKEYYVRLLGKNHDKTITIKNVDSLPKDPQAQYLIFNQISYLTTAVGVIILPKIAGLVATVIKARYESKNELPLNIIACENAIRATTILKQHVLVLLDEPIKTWMKGKIAFPDAATDSIVPTIASDDPLLVTGELFAEIIIDKKTFLGELPSVDGLLLQDDLDAYIERKLFTLNTGHAITAYLGAKSGIKTIDEAIAQPEIRATVLGAMRESGAVLINRYGFDPEIHETYIQKILKRFENPFLKDLTVRVAREPLRKLSYNDRLIKPLRGTSEYNLPNESLLKGIQAALSYHNFEDQDSLKIETMLKSDQTKAIVEITGLQNNNSNEKQLIHKIIKML
ncbi:MAG: mannitol-1-phosphate 5-dehydrogenase [Brevinema sp.]